MTASPSSPVRPTAPALEHRSSQWLVQNEGRELVGTVTEVGKGLPVVFLHGLVGLNEHWEGVVDRASHSVHCTLFELPLLQLRGSDCSVQGVARYTTEFLRARHKEPVVLVGNSFGGHVALRIALENPELVRGLVLAGSSGLIEKTMVREITVRPSREWLVRKIGELFYDQSFMRDADVDRAHRELSDRLGARAMVKLSRSARSDHLGERISAIEHPSLLIWGRQDVVTPPEAAEEFRARLRNSRIVWFDRCGHAPMIECPDLFADALLDFCADLSKGAASPR